MGSVSPGHTGRGSQPPGRTERVSPAPGHTGHTERGSPPPGHTERGSQPAGTPGTRSGLTARRSRQEAVQLARQKERELEERGERCNSSVLELWERCKPCLRRNCLRFYSRTCRRGAGAVGRQVRGTGHRDTGKRAEFGLIPIPSPLTGSWDTGKRAGLGSGLGWNVIGMGSMEWDWDGIHGMGLGWDTPQGCPDPIPVPDCGDADPSQQELREQLEDAVRVAERFTRRYDALLREFQEEMLNTSGLLDQLNRQFGWVSRLANFSREPDGFLQVTTVRLRDWGRDGIGSGAGVGPGLD
ncbi:clusterin-like [Malurus melanocephalus]|uniref:clusterin-like n=1 Tax=Malurus melanocephalus TaxID=175006 RepID=UPI0025489D88|nr:clusterin-like [Malurus melanocephalus]